MRGFALVLLTAIACAPAGSGDEDAWDLESSTSGSSGSSTAANDTSSDVTSSSTGESSSTADSTTGGDPPPATPARYPSDRTHSPITAFVAENLQSLRTVGPDLADDVFMKVGASSDVSPSNLHCFATDVIDLGRHDLLAGTLDGYLAGDAAGTSPFDRESFATEAGRSATWAIDGDPSPLQLEVDAIAPGLAFVHYGTNDMGLGVDPGAALPGFFESMSALLDTLEQRGVVPVVIGLTRRGDNPDANRWVATYNAVLRAIAQARQIPFVDAWWAIDPLDGHGLGPDGLHLEAYAEGACMLDKGGLEHGYNVRNLIQLESLARIDAALAGEPADDEVLAPLDGDGSSRAPWVIDALPFIHDGDTMAGAPEIDLYDCSPADESGPELAYALELTTDTALRVIVLDREDVDVDVHLLSGSGGESCVVRDDSIIAGTRAAGSWRVVVDSWSDGAVDYPGRFVLTVVPCDADDPDCAA